MEVSIISILPFILLLLSIAVLPFVSPGFWEKRYPYISMFLAFTVIIYYLIVGKIPELIHAGSEYVMFISLLTALFVVSGGILIELRGYSTPLRNVILLAMGAVLANFIGTTGASMLLIRPFIKTNKLRISAFHIVFFIFIVSNIGGTLTPIGDPPLFLGFLKGIPFFWISSRMILKWLFANSILLTIFYVFDLHSFKKQPDELKKREVLAGEKLALHGWYNVLIMLIVVASVFITRPVFLREAVMLIAAIVSYKITNKKIHHGNYFNFHPIKEVAWLFAGIFITLAPAIGFLHQNSEGLAAVSPGTYFWMTGLLSAFLDNAPTYLTFMTASMSAAGFDINQSADVLKFISSNEASVIAISLSAVCFGAFSYLGNGPNFMIKAVAAQQGIRMPGFLGYIIKYSIPILIPLFALLWLLFIL